MAEKFEKHKIGVFGSSLGNHTKKEMSLAYELGREIAKNKCVLVTGATNGLPNQAVLGAHKEKGFTLGISPASNKNDHLYKFKMPVDDDIIVYTGLDFLGRNLINIRASDAAIFIKGNIGTLNELTIAINEEKVIGILEGSGGISAKMKNFLDFKMNFNPKIIYSDDPKELVKKVIGALRAQ